MEKWNELWKFVEENQDKMSKLEAKEIIQGNLNGKRASTYNGAKQAYQKILHQMEQLELDHDED